MTGKSPEERQILDAQAAVLTGTLEHAGYMYIEPDILQPAGVFLSPAQRGLVDMGAILRCRGARAFWSKIAL